MSATPQSCRVIILVKALPQRSAKHGETVCCAGITPEGQWKRLYPVRFRHLKEENSFKRWDFIDFKYVSPPRDSRKESCRVFEDTIAIGKSLAPTGRAAFLNPLVLPSVKAAEERGDSLALIRPIAPRFSYKQKSAADLQEERESYRLAASQHSLLDDDLAALEPSPYEFKFKFRDADASHEYTNGDWEAHAMYFLGRKRGQSEAEVLAWMDHTFNVEYPKRGMLFAIGNQAKRPHVWQLLGVLRVDEPLQGSLAL
ncbi:hypothetical protein [Mesorhizobium sp.]|uniref:hypothetical protein n=1 Tax=Mesorhizobium sp. TaxID=1871066 RepID=UPI0025C57B31|nr:hypothetical protein [Mesorhizobium sp.]